ncbi:MAG TPA: DUF551 domain-containing protein [Ramlibacter sp.]|nr:DUF551 domain-containing protein [Ramlibacter sp.]
MTAQVHGVWHSVKDELPQGANLVLVFWRGAPGTDTFGVARYTPGDPSASDSDPLGHDRWIDIETGEPWGTPTHWMPLPEPPK